mgnify:CR=1 FL=1
MKDFFGQIFLAKDFKKTLYIFWPKKSFLDKKILFGRKNHF